MTDYIQFLFMMPETILILVFLSIFVLETITCKLYNFRSGFNTIICCFMLLQMAILFLSYEPVSVFGGMYVSTPATSVMKIILSIGTIIVLLQSRQWITESDINEQYGEREGDFYLLIVSTLLGMYMMISAGHFLIFFLGLEMASVPLACLVAFNKYKKLSAEAAAKYILTATFSSGIMLYGISFIYAVCGTLYFNDVTTALANGEHLTMSIVGLVFFFSGLAFKISLVPFHFWTADTYQGAPTPVTGYLSVVSKGAAAFALFTILTKVFQPMVDFWMPMLYVVIVLSITVANLFAIRQTDLKRFMAFSSISQAGYIMLAVIGNSNLSMASLMYYILIYVVANLAVFTIIGAVEENGNGRTDIDAYNGFYQTNPRLAFLMTLALFSLAGIPPFAGMFSKFFVFMAAASEGSIGAYVVLFIALINTVVSLYYYLLIVKAMYIKGSDKPMPYIISENATKVALAVCTTGIVAFGVCSSVFDWLESASVGRMFWNYMLF